MGIKIGDSEIKISQLADDMTCFIADTNSIVEIMNIFDQFKMCAGLKVNLEKTKANFIGSLQDRVDSPLGLEWSDECINTLGVRCQLRQVIPII